MRWVLVVIMISILVLGPTLGTVVEADAKETDVSFVSDPLYADVNRPINLANATHADSVISEWETDMGTSMPNGTYFGSLTQPGLFQHNIKPVEINPDVGYLSNVTGDKARYTTVIVSAHFNWSKQVLMSGCSEWWVRIPIHPDSIGDFSYLAIFKDVNNASLIDFYDYYNFTPQMDVWEFYPDFIRPTYNGQMPQDIFKYMQRQSMGFSHYTFDHGEMVRSSDHLYLKVHSILRPETDYVISYAFYIPKNKVLKTYWNTGESPCGGWSSIVVADADIEFIDGPGAHEYYQTTVVDSQKMEVNLDLDYSFIFTQGIGPGGLFGVKFQLESTTRNCSAEDVPYETYYNVWSGIVNYPFYNSSLGDPEYMSFMLPFISNDTFYCTPRVDNAVLFYGIHGWKFEDDSSSFITQFGWNYSDFILFSTSEKVNYTSPANAEFLDTLRWNVKVNYMIYQPSFIGQPYLQPYGTDIYRKSINITLLCYEPPRIVRYWSEIDCTYNGGLNSHEFSNSSINPWLRPYVYTWDRREYGSIDGPYYYLDNLGMTYNYLGYNIWQSARGTEGQWALRNMTASGEYTYSYHFPQIIHLSPHKWVAKSTNETRPVTSWGRYWGMAQDAWATGHYFQAIYYGIRGTISYIFDGLPGIIYDKLNDLWDGIKKFGTWIYTKIVEFIGKIYDFLQEVGDHLVTFWESAKYAIAPLMMVTIISYSTKFSKTARRDAE